MSRYSKYRGRARSYGNKYRRAYSEFSRESRLIMSVVGSIIIVYAMWYALNYYALEGLYAYVPALFGLLAGALLIIHKNEKTTFIGVVICASSAVLVAFQYGLVSV
jgi:hypothetical protein